jgi:hypothetical protein
VKAGALIALVGAIFIVTSATGAARSSVSPDPAKMVLLTTDFSSASVSSQGYQKVESPVASEYSRDFERIVYHGQAIAFLTSDAAVVTSATTVKSQVAAILKTLSTKQGRLAFAGFIQENSPEGTTVTVGKPRVLRLGAASLEFAIKLKNKAATVYIGLAYIAVDRVLETLAAGTAGHAPAFATMKSLGSIVVNRALAGLLPQNTAAPTIFGTASVGMTLSASAGTWTGGKPTFSFQWLRCNATGAACVPIAGATAATYVPATADVGSTLRVAVTAKVPGGSVTAQSAPTAVVTAPGPPVNTVPPIITGTPAQGQTLSASTGTWTGSPTAYAYQWQHCDAAGANCVDVPGATAQTYLLSGADVSFSIRVRVTATNASGPASAVSPQTAVVA